jgi:iron(III) transport system permease protein
VHYALPPNHGQASAFSLGLLAVVVVMLHFYGRLSRHAERYQTITGKGFRPRPIGLGKLRYVAAGFLVFFFVLIVALPVGVLLWMSLMPVVQHISLEGLKLLTLDNYRTVLGSLRFMGAVQNSLILGAGTATLTSLFTLVCAWYVVRRYRFAWLIDQLATLPLTFPSIVLGVALLQVYLQLPFPFYGTLASIVFASWIRYLPYGMRYSYAGILQIHTELEQASAISGARQFTTFVRIVLPLVAPALTTCWMFVFLLSVGAVSLPILLIGPNSLVVSVLLFDLYENGSVTELAALGLAWTAFMTVVSASFYLIAKRYGLTVR